MIPGMLWFPVKDGSPQARWLFERHYSCCNPKRDRHNRITGPGEYMLLMTSDSLALFAWRKFIDKSGQAGVNCAIFRNEGSTLSSELILEAEQLAWQRWPGARLYTYVNPRKVKSSNPGYCFKAAGWKVCGITKRRNLIILEKLHDGLLSVPEALSAGAVRPV
jgi:hypothetical protein